MNLYVEGKLELKSGINIYSAVWQQHFVLLTFIFIAALLVGLLSDDLMLLLLPGNRKIHRQTLLGLLRANQPAGLVGRLSAAVA